MKRLMIILSLFCATALSENYQVAITPDMPEHAGVRFSVFSEHQTLRHDQFQQVCVVIAITPNDNSAMQQTAAVEVWNDNQYVYSGAIPTCRPVDIPDNIRKQIKADRTILFSFMVNPEYLSNSRFSYQIGANGPDDEPTDCVIHFGKYIEAQAGSVYAPQGVGSPDP